MKNKKIIILILLITLFIINTILVMNNVYVNIDDTIHNTVLHMHSEITTKIMHIITFFGSTPFMVGFAITLFLAFLIMKKKIYAISSASLIIISTIINNVIKPLVGRARPEYITVVEKSLSYPSGHMMASTTMYGFIIYLIIKSNIENKYKYLFSCMLGVWIILIGISRIYLGAHFFSDVLGAFLASMSLLVIFMILNDKKKWIK
jgi:undecaprenyl-diphosphatase